MSIKPTATPEPDSGEHPAPESPRYSEQAWLDRISFVLAFCIVACNPSQTPDLAWITIIAIFALAFFRILEWNLYENRLDFLHVIHKGARPYVIILWLVAVSSFFYAGKQTTLLVARLGMIVLILGMTGIYIFHSGAFRHRFGMAADTTSIRRTDGYTPVIASPQSTFDMIAFALGFSIVACNPSQTPDFAWITIIAVLAVGFVAAAVWCATAFGAGFFHRLCRGARPYLFTLWLALIIPFFYATDLEKEYASLIGMDLLIGIQAFMLLMQAGFPPHGKTDTDTGLPASGRHSGCC